MTKLTIEKAREVLEPTKWTRPEAYYGHNPVGDYVILTHHRDSSIAEHSNFEVGESRLEEAEKPFEETITDDQMSYSFSANHAAVGWLDYLIVPQCAPDDVVIAAAEIVSSLEGWYLLDDDHYSEKCSDAVENYWRTISLSERVACCREAGETIFAARHDYAPNKVYDDLSEQPGFF